MSKNPGRIGEARIDRQTDLPPSGHGVSLPQSQMQPLLWQFRRLVNPPLNVVWDQQDSLAGKGAHCQACQPEFAPRDPGEGEEILFGFYDLLKFSVEFNLNLEKATSILKQCLEI